jgi:hypothetical protein
MKATSEPAFAARAPGEQICFQVIDDVLFTMAGGKALPRTRTSCRTLALPVSLTDPDLDAPPYGLKFPSFRRDCAG